MIIKRDIKFTPSNATRQLHIYLPESYSQGHELYPVMYFFDGHNLFNDEDATFGKSWGLKDFLENWGKDIIIVGIECGHVGNERLREYCPYTFHGNFWGGTLKGTGHKTLQWMVSELKPVIDSDYRTWPHREATGIGGSSMGGLMALYGAVCFNDWFSKAACVSSTISPCIRPQAYRLTTVLYPACVCIRDDSNRYQDRTQERPALRNMCSRQRIMCFSLNQTKIPRPCIRRESP